MKLARINTSLFIAIIVINSYIICAPFLPALSFWINGRFGHRSQAIQAIIDKPAAAPAPDNVPSTNRLLIPSMQLDAPIIEGRDARALRDGPWRRPNTSTPDKGGNTVIAAHRFTYTQPRGSFYHLDAVKVGDTIAIFWHAKKYVYIVREIKTVHAADTTIEAPTTSAHLTLYTCTPLWMPKDRLVVIATPKEQS